jgi:hypothetical protein
MRNSTESLGKVNYNHIYTEPIITQENFIQFFDQKQFLLSGRIYDNGFSTSEL